MNIELSSEEVEALKSLLHSEIGEINPQIHHSATYAKRDELKEHRQILQKIYKQLDAEEN